MVSDRTNSPDISQSSFNSLLVVRRVLREQLAILHPPLVWPSVRDDEVCRRLMTTPAVGPVAGADLPRHRRCASRASRNSKAVGAGIEVLTPSRYRSGEIASIRRDIKMRGRDDASDALRSEPRACSVRSAKWSWLKACGPDADRQAPRHEEGNRRAGASLCAVIMRRTVDGAEPPWSSSEHCCSVSAGT